MDIEWRLTPLSGVLWDGINGNLSSGMLAYYAAEYPTVYLLTKSLMALNIALTSKPIYFLSCGRYSYL
jgi:hypothetical protein